MRRAIDSLNLDLLVRKHVRISPACRYLQLICLALGSVPLLLLTVLVFFVAVDVISFIDSYGMAVFNYHNTEYHMLDFRWTRFAIYESLFGETLRPYRPTAFALIVSLLSLFLALSFISFRIDLFALASLSFLSLRGTMSLIEKASSEYHEWQTAVPKIAGGVQIAPAGPSIVTDVWIQGVNIYFFFIVMSALYQYYATPEQEGYILREGAQSIRFSSSTLLQAFGIPPNIRNSARRIRTVLFAYLGNLVGVGLVALLLLAGPYMERLFWAAAGPYLWGWYNPGVTTDDKAAFVSFLSDNIESVTEILLLGALLAISFRFVGNRCLRISRRFLRVSLQQAQAADSRRPVLFLRSFRDDAVALPPPKTGFAYKLFNYSERNKSLDELLLEEGTALGPVVGLGNPTDPVPPYGAARGYAKGSDWQKMVADLMEAAVAIAICIDDTESLWWEIEHVAKSKYLDKTLLVLHPKYEGKTNASEMIRKIEQLFGLSIIEGTDATFRGNFVGLWLDAGSGLHVGLASRWSRAHYLLMLRWFLRSKIDEVALKSSKQFVLFNASRMHGARGGARG